MYAPLVKLPSRLKLCISFLHESFYSYNLVNELLTLTEFYCSIEQY